MQSASTSTKKLRDRQPTRMCVSCGKRTEISNLLRVVNDAADGLRPDPRRRLPGRGAHVCLNTGCIQRALNKRLFNRAFRMNVNTQLLRAVSVSMSVEVESSSGGLL